jgi:histidine triad (HIT) family protein
VSKEIPSNIVFENDDVICIHDLKPITPVHVLIIPKRHFDDILSLSTDEGGSQAMTAVLSAVPEIVKKLDLEKGFRIINNCRSYGGQTVQHIHFHIIGGRELGEKML